MGKKMKGLRLHFDLQVKRCSNKEKDTYIQLCSNDTLIVVNPILQSTGTSTSILKPELPRICKNCQKCMNRRSKSIIMNLDSFSCTHDSDISNEVAQMDLNNKQSKSCLGNNISNHNRVLLPSKHFRK